VHNLTEVTLFIENVQLLHPETDCSASVSLSHIVAEEEAVTLETVDQCPPCPNHFQESHWCPYTLTSDHQSWPTQSQKLSHLKLWINVHLFQIISKSFTSVHILCPQVSSLCPLKVKVVTHCSRRRSCQT